MNHNSVTCCFSYMIRTTIIFSTIIFFQFFSTLPTYGNSEQETVEKRPTIGVTLSGGGARGLAHIGVLQAIDNAGLQVDYVTGTSMGAILGALYSAGYSADTIEHIAKNLNWEPFFRGQTTMDKISFEEKESFNKFSIELPVEDRRPRFASGLIEGQELMLTLSELFFPVYDKKDFNDFDIPFRCVATDLSTGEAIELDSGEISTAVRASMAIPSVFTAVNYQGRTFIDGGVARNFPVRNVKEMGADFVIGSSVSVGLRDAEEIKNPLDVIYQMGFFKDAAYYPQEIAMTDILVLPEVRDFSAASFSDVDKIIEAGKKAGEKWIESFKSITDTLPADKDILNRLPVVNEITIDNIHIDGIKGEEKDFFKNSLLINEGDKTRGRVIIEAVRNLYGTRRYKKINHKLVPKGDKIADLHFDIEPNPTTHLKAALNYNSQAGSSVIAGLSRTNLLFSNSLAKASVNLGDNQHWRLRYHKFTGLGRRYSISAFSDMENIELPYYEDYSLTQEYRAFYFNSGLKLQQSPNRNFGWGVRSKYEWYNYSPKITSSAYVDGHLTNLKHKVFIQHNSKNHRYFPTAGSQINLQGGIMHNIKTDSDWDKSEEGITPSDPLFFGELNLWKTSLIAENYYLDRSGNINIIRGENVPLPYKTGLGGLNQIRHNQTPFAGLAHNEVSSSSIATVNLSLRRPLTNQFFVSLQVSGGFFDFANSHYQTWDTDQVTSGHAVSASYDSRFGPLTFSLMHSFISGDFNAYINIGHHF